MLRGGRKGRKKGELGGENKGTKSKPGKHWGALLTSPDQSFSVGEKKLLLINEQRGGGS